ncbi:MAG: hypothetical protein ACPLRU_04910, partial [Desulfofundulus sp.]
SVEGIHSFVASGIVVSNSFLEFGTSKMSARPWLRPAVDEKQQEALKAVEDTLRRVVDRLTR